MPKQFRFFKWQGKTAAALLALTILLVAAAIGGTVAFIIDRTAPMENTFGSATVDSEPVVTTGANGETLVAAKNTGDVPAYVRIAMSVSWMKTDENGKVTEVHAIEPILNDSYRIEFAADDADHWVFGRDGFIYYTKPLEAGATTCTAITFSAIEGAVPPAEGFDLSLGVVTSAIQSDPVEAVIESWGVTVAEDGTLNPPND